MEILMLLMFREFLMLQVKFMYLALALVKFRRWPLSFTVYPLKLKIKLASLRTEISEQTQSQFRIIINPFTGRCQLIRSMSMVKIRALIWDSSFLILYAVNCLCSLGQQFCIVNILPYVSTIVKYWFVSFLSIWLWTSSSCKAFWALSIQILSELTFVEWTGS